MEKIIIENFGGIKSIEFKFESINLLIGPQASGKSVTVKLCFYFKSFFEEMFEGIDSGELKRQIDNKHKEKFLNFFPKESWGKGYFRIEYWINNSWMKIERKSGSSLNFTYSDDIKKLLRKGRNFHRNEQKKFENEPKSSHLRISRKAQEKFQNYINNVISPISTFNQYFVPAGRSFFANIQSSIFSFLSDNRSIDPFLIEFGSFYESFKRYIYDDFGKDRKEKDFDELMSLVMCGQYKREKDKDYWLFSKKLLVVIYKPIHSGIPALYVPSSIHALVDIGMSGQSGFE